MKSIPLHWLLASLVLLAASIVVAQEVDTGEFVYRDSQGGEFAMRSVVTSERMSQMLLNQQLIMDRLDILLADLMVPPQQVSLNTASFEELQTVPGIGAVKAGSIIATRGSPDVVGYSPFTSWADLAARVNGIGQGTIGDIQAAGVLLDPAE